MDCLKQKRTSARAQNTKIINEATASLGSESADRATLISLKERLTSSNEKLKKISEDTDKYIPTEELAYECATAADYEDQVVAILARLQCKTEDINNFQRSVDAGNSASTVHVSVNVGNVNVCPRLPQLQMKPFNGNIREWTFFREQFDGTVRSNSALSETDKFNCHQNDLKREAAAAITGFVTTSACYVNAVQLLNDRYGDKLQIDQHHL